MDGQGDITRLLERMGDGDSEALNELTPMVYAQLHRMASKHFRGDRGHGTLQPTAIVNEAYIQLVGSSVDWASRKHFYALASKMMRNVVINHVNARRTAKRGGDAPQVTFQEGLIAGEARGEDVLDLDEAMQALAEVDAEQVEFLELFYFGGLTYDQIGEIKDVSPATVKRKLRFARAWINRFLEESAEE